MAPLPTITDVYRIAMSWTNTGGVAPVNVFHVRTTGSPTLDQIALRIGACFVTGGASMWGGAISSCHCQSVQITPLDGITAATDHSLGTTVVGSGTGDQIPNSALVMSFKTTQRGARGRGRMYIGPLGETVVANGFFTPTAVSDAATAWGNFLNALMSGTPSMHLVIASYKHADAHDVVSVRCNSKMGTQRRRLARA